MYLIRARLDAQTANQSIEKYVSYTYRSVFTAHFISFHNDKVALLETDATDSEDGHAFYQLIISCCIASYSMTYDETLSKMFLSRVLLFVLEKYLLGNFKYA